ncbi:MAG TPA: hypothetical protein VNY73_02510 [Bacteroidia bacterium]|jgi:hypothetical protein|nr:hypothetical protein [Bacteroidia bacterium]
MELELVSQQDRQIDFVMQITSHAFLEHKEMPPIEDFEERFEFIIHDQVLMQQFALFLLGEIQILIFDSSGDNAKEARETYNKGNSQFLN